MTIPTWAGSIVSNYRTQFRERYKRETTLTDDQIYTITKTVFNDEDTNIEDQDRVEAMFEDEPER